MIIWCLNQETLFKGKPCRSVPVSQRQCKAVLAMIERTRNSNERARGDGAKQMCCCFGEGSMVHTVSTRNTHTAAHTKLYTRAYTGAPLNHPSWGPIHLLLVDWDPITIPNSATMKERQTACEEAHSLTADWWDKSWGSSWGIPYQGKHTDKNIKNRLLPLPRCLCFANKVFQQFNHKKLIEMHQLFYVLLLPCA